jgi:hypothetical protein
LQRRQDVLPSAPTGRILVTGISQQNGILDKNLYDYWQFPGKADHVIHIAANPLEGNLRMDVAIYGPNGYLSSVTADAKAGALTLGPLRLPIDGTYQVVVGRWLGASGKTTGRYSLLLSNDSDTSALTLTPIAALPSIARDNGNDTHNSADPNPAQPAMTVQGEIAPGSTASGTLDLAQFGHEWDFTAAASPSIAVTARATTAGLRLRALFVRRTGELLGVAESGNDGVVNLQAALPSADRYALLIMPDAPGQAGGYQFTLSYALAPTGGGRLLDGVPISGMLTNADFSDSWRFTGKAGGTLTLSKADTISTAGDFKIVLRVFAPDNTEIPQTGDKWILPRDGSYTLVVTRREGAIDPTEGSYQLTPQLR